MQKASRDKDIGVLAQAAFLAVALLYIGVVFPRCFFRHDDWWILGNSALRLPQDWGFLWRPTLYFSGTEIPWFFRPFFKLLTYLYFQVFGYWYYGWLLVNASIVVATIACLRSWIRQLNPASGAYSELVLAVFFVTAIPLHFGNLAWVGEGLMNIPQAFLLAGCTWSIAKAAKKKEWVLGYSALAAVLFGMALGFKESAVFHLFFLAALGWSEPYFKKIPWRRRAVLFSPLLMMTVLYLAVRLGWMPWNQSYVPEKSLEKIARSAILFWGGLALPALVWIAADVGMNRRRLRAWAAALKARWAYAVYFGVSGVVYLGQDFFSPGWWYVPGLALAALVALAASEVNQVVPAKKPFALFYRTTAVAGAFCLVLTVAGLWRLGWWDWSQSQRQVHALMKQADSQKIREWVIYHCDNPRYPDVTFFRVVGDPQSLSNQWELLHGTPLSIRFKYCREMEQIVLGQLPWEQPGQLAFQWRFPSLTPIGQAARALSGK